MGRDLSATIGDRELRVAIERASEDLFRVVIDDQLHEVDARRVRANTWSLIIDGRSHLVDLDERQGRKLALCGGGETSIELVDARRKALAEAVGAKTVASGELIAAPIAGRVVKLVVEVGAEVAVGDPVIVLEAMKMENELKAERGGVVVAVHVEAGQSVETRQKLVTLE